MLGLITFIYIFKHQIEPKVIIFSITNNYLTPTCLISLHIGMFYTNWNLNLTFVNFLTDGDYG